MASPVEPSRSDAELATIEQSVSDPVDLDEPSAVAEGVTASITSMEAIEAEASGIGEIAGPALRFVVTVENKTSNGVSLANSVVNVEFGSAGLPAVQLTGSGATEFLAPVAAGESVSTIRILVNLEASAPVAAFVGAVSGEEG